MRCASWGHLALLYITQLLPSDGAPVLSPDQISLKELARSADSVRTALKKSEIIPDVLDDFSPSVLLTLSYPSSHQTVSLGNTIPPSDASSPPVFEIHPLSSPSTISPTRTLASNRTYTLILTDPDATSRANPTKGQMCHWIATGISLSSKNSSEGIDEANAYTLELSPHARDDIGAKVNELVEYMAPAPPEGTGKHRYVFVLLASEDEGKGKREPKKPEDRPHWGYEKVGTGVREWARDNGLIPIGANFFYAQNKKQ